jgi:hypothetical protein
LLRACLREQAADIAAGLSARDLARTRCRSRCVMAISPR